MGGKPTRKGKRRYPSLKERNEVKTRKMNGQGPREPSAVDSSVISYSNERQEQIQKEPPLISHNNRTRASSRHQSLSRGEAGVGVLNGYGTIGMARISDRDGARVVPPLPKLPPVSLPPPPQNIPRRNVTTQGDTVSARGVSTRSRSRPPQRENGNGSSGPVETIDLDEENTVSLKSYKTSTDEFTSPNVNNNNINNGFSNGLHHSASNVSWPSCNHSANGTAPIHNSVPPKGTYDVRGRDKPTTAWTSGEYKGESTAHLDSTNGHPLARQNTSTSSDQMNGTSTNHPHVNTNIVNTQGFIEDLTQSQTRSLTNSLTRSSESRTHLTADIRNIVNEANNGASQQGRMSRKDLEMTARTPMKITDGKDTSRRSSSLRSRNDSRGPSRKEDVPRLSPTNSVTTAPPDLCPPGIVRQQVAAIHTSQSLTISSSGTLPVRVPRSKSLGPGAQIQRPRQLSDSEGVVLEEAPRKDKHQEEAERPCSSSSRRSASRGASEVTPRGPRLHNSTNPTAPCGRARSKSGSRGSHNLPITGSPQPYVHTQFGSPISINSELSSNGASGHRYVTASLDPSTERRSPNNSPSFISTKSHDHNNPLVRDAQQISREKPQNAVNAQVHKSINHGSQPTPPEISSNIKQIGGSNRNTTTSSLFEVQKKIRDSRMDFFAKERKRSPIDEDAWELAKRTILITPLKNPSIVTRTTTFGVKEGSVSTSKLSHTPREMTNDESSGVSDNSYKEYKGRTTSPREQEKLSQREDYQQQNGRGRDPSRARGASTSRPQSGWEQPAPPPPQPDMVKCYIGATSERECIEVPINLITSVSPVLKKKLRYDKFVLFGDYNLGQIMLLIEFAEKGDLFPSAENMITYFRMMRDFEVDFGERLLILFERDVLTVDNVLMFYGEAWEIAHAREICEKLIKRNGERVLEKWDQFKSLTQRQVNAIISLRMYNCHSQLFEAIVVWIDTNSDGMAGKEKRFFNDFNEGLSSLINIDNVFHVYKATWRSLEARKVCELVIRSHAQLLINSSNKFIVNEFNKLGPDQLASVLGLVSHCPSVDIFTAIIGWVDNCADGRGWTHYVDNSSFGRSLMDAVERLLNVENVLTLYKMGWEYGAIRECCANFISRNARNVLKRTEEFIALNLDQVKGILEIAAVREYTLDLFRALISWCDQRLNDPSIKPLGRDVHNLITIDKVLYFYKLTWGSVTAKKCCLYFIRKNVLDVVKQVEAFSNLDYEQVHSILINIVPLSSGISELFYAIVAWMEAESDRECGGIQGMTCEFDESLYKYIEEMIRLDNIFEFYEISKKCVAAREICEAFIMKHLQIFLEDSNSHAFNRLLSDQVSSIISLVTRREPSTTVQLFKTVVGWIENEVERQVKRNSSLIDLGSSFYDALDELITVDNVLIFYGIAWNCEVAREICEEFIQREANSILKNTQQFNALSAEQVRAILEMDVLCAREFDVFRAIVAWIDAQVSERRGRFTAYSPDYSADEKRALLKTEKKNPLGDIRFPSMSMQEFLSEEGPWRSELLKPEEKAEILTLFTRNAPLNMIPYFQSTPRWGSPDGMEIEMVRETTAWKGCRPGTRYALQICSNQNIRFPCRIGFTCPANTNGLVVNYSIWRGSCIEMKRTHLEYNGEDEPLSAIADSAYMMHLQANVQYMIMAQFSQQVPMGNIRERKYTLKHPLYSDATVTVSPPSAEMVDMFGFEDASQMGPITKLWFCR